MENKEILCHFSSIMQHYVWKHNKEMWHWRISERVSGLLFKNHNLNKENFWNQKDKMIRINNRTRVKKRVWIISKIIRKERICLHLKKWSGRSGKNILIA